jgi:hypothetical protein
MPDGWLTLAQHRGRVYFYNIIQASILSGDSIFDPNQLWVEELREFF